MYVNKYWLVAIMVLIAGVPTFIFYRYVNDYAISATRSQIHQYGARIVENAERILDTGMSALATLAERDVAGCGEFARGEMIGELDRFPYASQVAVLELSGKMRCSAALVDRPPGYFSHENPMNRLIGLGVVIDRETLQRSIGLRRRDGEESVLMLVFAPEVFGLDILPERWRASGLVRLKLADGTEFQTIPRPRSFSGSLPDENRSVVGEVRSDRYPVKAQIVVPIKVATGDFEGLIRNGTIAIGIFSTAMSIFAAFMLRRGMSVEDELRVGFRNGEFVPLYQPIIDMKRGCIEGCEVLMRRRLPNGTIIGPLDFIDQMERSGLIIDATRKLMADVRADLEEVCRDDPNFHIAFNLCSRHFEDDVIVDDAMEIFRESCIAMDRIVFEITERQPLEDLDKVRATVRKLQRAGCRVALDDAGTGHAGLAVVQSIPFDIIKIDKVFIDSIYSEHSESPIIDTLASLGRKLGMTVLAEGVESTTQVEYLRSRGVRFMQGYLFAPPLTVGAIRDLARAMAPASSRRTRAGARAGSAKTGNATGGAIAAGAA